MPKHQTGGDLNRLKIKVDWKLFDFNFFSLCQMTALAERDLNHKHFTQNVCVSVCVYKLN